MIRERLQLSCLVTSNGVMRERGSRKALHDLQSGAAHERFVSWKDNIADEFGPHWKFC
jgi:hypothetical protein